MSDETLRQFTPTFHAAEAIHLFVKPVKRRFRLLAGMSETGGSLAVLSLADVDIIGGMKLLCLLPLIHFEIVKIECPAAFDPRIVNQQRCGAMVPMGINRPMGENYIWTFGLKNFAEIIVADTIYFRIAIDLAGKYRSCSQDRTSFLAFRSANGCGLLCGFAWNPSFSASQIDHSDFMSQIGIKSNRASTS